MLDLALISAVDAAPTDADLAPLLRAASDFGISSAVWCWDDPQVDWSGCRLAVLRSPWNYTERYAEFVAWLERAAKQTQILNPPEVVRWNTDKRYLLELAQAGAPVIETLALTPGSSLQRPDAKEFVLKPAIGAGSQGARRFRRAQTDEAQLHLTKLHNRGLTALAQPYLDRVDHGGETALLYFDGVYSHAVRKNAILKPDQAEPSGMFAAETITPRTPNDKQRGAANQVLQALARSRPTDASPLYARIDLLDDGDGEPRLLELELAEPSLFFKHAAGSAERFVERISQRMALSS